VAGDDRVLGVPCPRRAANPAVVGGRPFQTHPCTKVEDPTGDVMQAEQPSFKPLDPGRVDMLDQFERQYWCHTLHCTESELATAVASVGDHVTKVREYLTGKR